MGRNNSFIFKIISEGYHFISFSPSIFLLLLLLLLLLVFSPAYIKIWIYLQQRLLDMNSVPNSLSSFFFSPFSSFFPLFSSSFLFSLLFYSDPRFLLSSSLTEVFLFFLLLLPYCPVLQTFQSHLITSFLSFMLSLFFLSSFLSFLFLTSPFLSSIFFHSSELPFPPPSLLSSFPFFLSSLFFPIISQSSSFLL